MKRIIRLLAFALALLLVLSGCRRIEEGEIGPEETEEKEAEIVYPRADGKIVIMLDAGHGFRDIGCDTELLQGTEAEVTLNVVMLLKAELEKRGARVHLTHDGVTFPSAEEIKAKAGKAGVEYREEDIIENDIFSAYERAIYTASVADDMAIDFFISLHVNSIEGHPEMSRYEIDYYEDNPFASALKVFCEDLAGRLDNETKIFEDSFDNAFLVTKHGSYPSVLFEMGYATNEADAENINSKEWREDLAKILAESILDWISSYEEK